jgi:hypothetical protein
VQGVLAISADGSHVYFVAKGVLTSASNAQGETAQEEADNLYVYSAGQVTFITTLSPSDEPQWRFNTLQANVAPDGRFLVFTSRRALTKDDTRNGSEIAAQVFEYDSVTRALVRISIGEKGFNDNGNAGVGDAAIVQVSRGTEAGSVPVRSDPTMSDNGAFVFFQSPLALTRGALDDVSIGIGFAQNVYEYHEGHVFLISDGKDTSPQTRLSISPVELLGSDASGSNVFFATFDQLVPSDTDTQRDYYDAHICSIGIPCIAPTEEPPAPCAEGACQSSSAAIPSFGAPSSSTFTGAGNLGPPSPAPSAKPKPLTRAQKLVNALKACRKKHGKSRAACERKARRAYGAVKAARPKARGSAGHKRGAG